MATVDAFELATETAERPPIFWGKVDVSAELVVLIKGQSKQPFDPTVHSPDQRRVELDFLVNPIDEMNMATMIQRRLLDNDRAWRGIVWPSLRTLGCKSARDIDRKWAKVETVKSGETYTNKNGQTVEKSTLRFLAMFNSEAECIADFHKARGGKPEPAEDDPAGDVDMSPTVPTTDGSVGTSAERETALQFLGFFVKQANGNKAALAQAIAANEMIARYFTINSPEVQALAAFK